MAKSGVGERPLFSLAGMPVHARVAALLAPGFSEVLGADRRGVLIDLSLLPGRRVVRMVRLSGLGDLDAFFLEVEEAYGGS